MKRIPKQEYTPEFKELSVKRVKSGQSISSVAKDLGLIEQTLRNWIKAADAGKLNGTGGKVVTPEQMELSRLRAENIRLKRECEILKRGETYTSNAYFARETLRSTPGLTRNVVALGWTRCVRYWMSLRAATGLGRVAAGHSASV